MQCLTYSWIGTPEKSSQWWIILIIWWCCWWWRWVMRVINSAAAEYRDSCGLVSLQQLRSWCRMNHWCTLHQDWTHAVCLQPRETYTVTSTNTGTDTQTHTAWHSWALASMKLLYCTVPVSTGMDDHVQIQCPVPTKSTQPCRPSTGRCKYQWKGSDAVE